MQMADAYLNADIQQYADAIAEVHSSADVLSDVFEQDSRRYVSILDEGEQVK